jgi:hypothetical protein
MQPPAGAAPLMAATEGSFESVKREPQVLQRGPELHEALAARLVQLGDVEAAREDARHARRQHNTGNAGIAFDAFQSFSEF